LAVEDPTDVRWGDTGVAPGGGDRYAHLILGGVAGAVVEAHYSGYSAAGQLVEARALGGKWLSIGMHVSSGIHLSVMKRVGGAKLRELLEEVEGYTPLSGFRDTRYAEGVSAADVADDGFMVSECDHVAGRNYIVDAYEGRAVTIWYDGQRIGSNMRCLLDGFRFHVAVSDGGSRRGGSNVGLPLRVGHE